MRRLLLALFLLPTFGIPGHAQSAGNDACAAPTFPKLARERNMFSEQQEA